MLSLMLTLIAIPVLYTWFDDLARTGRRIASALRRHRPAVDRGAGELGLMDPSQSQSSSGLTIQRSIRI